MLRTTYIQKILPALYFLLATTASYCIAQFAFQFVLTSDENSYLFQANTFLDGLVARPFPPFHEAFQSHMIILNHQVGWLSRYPFGHPLYLVPGVFVGSPHLIVALTAGITLLIVYQAGKLLGGYSQGIISSTLLLFSPFFLFYHGTLFSHTSGLLASSFMLLMYISWRNYSNNIYALLSGLAWGYLFNTRTYSAFLIAIPFAFDSLNYLYHHRNQKVFNGTILFAIGSLTGVIALLAYNMTSIGDPWTLTYLYHNANDVIGFGDRYYGRIHHTFTRGIENLLENLQLLNVWLWGFWGSFVLCMALLVVGWKEYWTRLFIAVIASVLLGHIFFYYPGPREAGPGYYLEILPFLILGASFGVLRLVMKIKTWQFACLAAILISISTTFIIHNGQVYRSLTSGARKILDMIQEAPAGSLVFIELDELQSIVRPEHEILFNRLGLEGDVLIARSLGEQDKVLVRYFKERLPFLLVGGDRPNLAPIDPESDYDLLVSPEPKLSGSLLGSSHPSNI